MRAKLLLLFVIVPVIIFGIDVSDILKSSANLKTVSCHIRAENHSLRKVSVVEFDFYFKRPEKMRIDYTSPKSMRGSFIAVDGKYFYNYVASLKRKMKKRITGTKNPGKDLGVFFDYIVGDLDKALKGVDVSLVGSEKIEVNSKKIETFHFRFVKGYIGQEVWFDSKNLFPVKIEIYFKGKLKSRFVVWNLSINVDIDDGLFSPW